MLHYKYLESYKVTITKPDGTQDIMIKDSYVADATAWFEYVPDQTGEYSIKFDFLGQYFPNGTYFEGVNYPSIAAIGPYTAGQFNRPSYLGSIYYEPSSDGPYTLVVQDTTSAILAHVIITNRLLDKTSHDTQP